LLAHPANANEMMEVQLEKLARNIEREGRYPPLIVRPHPDIRDAYQLLDGHQRRQALVRLGLQSALCFVWPCDDDTALLLLATFNQLKGTDVPAKRSELVAELTALMPADELGRLLPEDATEINKILDMYSVNADSLLQEYSRVAGPEGARSHNLLSFSLTSDDRTAVEAAVKKASEGLNGKGRRGRALALIARSYLGEHGKEH
jgi:hypothetical protein